MAETGTVTLLIQEIENKLSQYKRDYEGLSWRDKVLLLVKIEASVKKLGAKSETVAARVSARERIRLYLVKHAGIVIKAAELEVVSGISDYGRRIRELRVEEGYKILTKYSNDPENKIHLKPSEYLLLDIEPDSSASRRWHIANRIRREKEGGSKGRLIRYLMENVGQIISSEELHYVAQVLEFGRRLRELRTEEGFAIATKFTGRPDLRMAEYILESSERVADPHDRRIPYDVQKVVYERDNNTCRLCGWNHERWSRDDPRILELHHVTEHAVGGANTQENLVVLCSRCHDDVHAGRSKVRL